MLEKAALSDELNVVEQHTLLVDMRRIRRHRSRRRTADIRVVAARRDVEFRPCDGTHPPPNLSLEGGGAFEKHRRDHGHIRQMRSAVVRRVEYKDVAGAHRRLPSLDDGLHTLAHRPQMHRHVRSVGDEIALAIEQGTGKIQALLDVHRVRRVGQRHAHLLRNRHEEIVEYLEQHRVCGRADGVRALDRRDALQQQMVECRERRFPPRLDHR